MDAVFSQPVVHKMLARLIPKNFGTLEKLEGVFVCDANKNVCAAVTIMRAHPNPTAGIYGCIWLVWKDKEDRLSFMHFVDTRPSGKIDVAWRYQQLGEDPQIEHLGYTFSVSGDCLRVEGENLVLNYSYRPTISIMTQSLGQQASIRLASLQLPS